jgi:Asp-tRNA(Asn)/Glu-tRNA(Gln) amidotransferase A subunit family amidase
MTQESHSGQSSEVSRRRALTTFLAAGTTAAAAAGISADESTPADNGITPEMLKNSEWMANLEVSEEDAERTARGVTRLERQLKKLREFQTGYETLPAMRFDPEQAAPESRKTSLNRPEWLTPQPADQIEPDVDGEPQVAFASLRRLGQQLRSGRLSSVRLTSACLELLKSRGPVLKCVVSLTEELALQQAERADKELQAGHDRGPLHGIPWGAKDLIAVPDYPTTWGAPQFRDRVLPNPATVYSRLTDAGAVLVAKLSLGALAMGDKWFEGMTRNPWNPEQGSSGSSAGSAAAVAAGLVPFAIGSETLGSIISPSRRCGVTSLRPTFGRVSRAGCMTLSWTMDKIGPMARRIDDIATVFSAIHGADAADPTTVDRWFEWPVSVSLKSLRVGHVQNNRTSPQEQIALDILKEQGATLVPIELPQDFPVWEMAAMLDVEAATVFHELTAQGEKEGLNSWPGIFRKAHFVSATDFLHAQRVRFELMKKMVAVFDSVDLYVGGNDLGITNLTGHPSVVLPTMMSEDEEHAQPVCCTLTGRLYDDATLLAAAHIIERSVALTDKVPPQHDTPEAEDSK